ncbi:DNA-3-methyladenine glycosylase [Hyphomicrobium sp. CS1GBMeth3]|uniref:DNA-3-methyladenine glycosylase family protein n=1 Tax=Hyphomicrobium sp. CS1GBMeth3 TaxID=1892845 RepID=UPI0009311375|nr:DNA-3-methyladenine glycosylase [Hyphomicrobium sp. CS1GBMeth3]
MKGELRSPKAKTPRVVAVRLITTPADVRVGTRALRKLCPTIKRVHDLVGDPAPRRHSPGFAGLARVVVGQQLSEASARAIWSRTEVAVDPFDAATLLAMDIAALRTAGLSQGKIRTLRAAAEAVVSGGLSFDARVPLDDLRANLLAISGIGPWTADIYTLFCLGHADGFAAGDLALQVAVQRAFALAERPSAVELEALAERWRPWRGVAALLLWSFYAKRNRG